LKSRVRGLTKEEREAAVPHNEAMFKKMRQKDYQLALNEVRNQGKDGDLLSRRVFSWHCKSKNITFVRFCFNVYPKFTFNTNLPTKSIKLTQISKTRMLRSSLLRSILINYPKLNFNILSKMLTQSQIS